MKLVKLIANLGYGSRKQVTAMFREGLITDADGEVLYADDKVEHAAIRIEGEPLDPPAGLVLMLHKPLGVTCSTKDPGRVVYDLLPPRFRRRSPLLSTVGRLDRDTSGLLLMTDDGALLHRIVSPKAQLAKVYEATLAQDLRGDEAGIFASGTLQLESETTPLHPAALEVLGPRHARLTLTEGRYHQVRRMFAAVGNHVDALHRPRIGGLDLGDLPAGQWRALGPDDLDRLFGGA
ncbi:pseudouridine synthase [Cognatilysobacter bugurensis]|uniref:Pseudouridine synthase n=1 Tax=Cognatilysobacter bugurensis TaxID=543356 RepID=A0A918SZ37_9GAMM|nr:pseudouridine synthase [Lysobacter bugurensis]GHA79770.1 pseudouridine synthase [Lysobacter bugurensis]